MSVIFGNATEGVVKWRPSPNERGSFDILKECILTIALCVWTTLHVNVPAAGQTAVKQFFGKVGWLCVGLLAPEVVLYIAWYQRREASLLTARIQRILGERPRRSWWDWRRDGWAQSNTNELDDLNGPRSARNARNYKWTLHHSFFALMGGYGFELSSTQAHKLKDMEATHMTFTPAALVLLHDQYLECMPKLTEDDIRDRSKADTLAKSITCIQALWFCIQCISRFAQGIPISLLELNVFGHAICALVIYILWWHKPLDVQKPMVVAMTDVDSGIPLSFPIQEYISLPGGSRYFIIKFAAREIIISDRVIFPLETLKGPLGMEIRSEGLTPYQDSGYVLCGSGAIEGKPPYGIGLDNLEKLQSVMAHPEPDRLKDTSNKLNCDSRIAVTYSSMLPHIGDLQSNSFYRPETKVRGLFGNYEKFWFFLVLIMASALYGGLHLVAWNAPFPSTTQQLLWRISAIAVTTMGLPIAVLFFPGIPIGLFFVIFGPSPRLGGCFEFIGLWVRIFFAAYWTPISRLLNALLILGYAIARSYLVVECFIFLFNSPPGVFNVPNWAAYFPHIS